MENPKIRIESDGKIITQVYIDGEKVNQATMCDLHFHAEVGEVSCVVERLKTDEHGKVIHINDKIVREIAFEIKPKIVILKNGEQMKSKVSVTIKATGQIIDMMEFTIPVYSKARWENRRFSRNVSRFISDLSIISFGEFSEIEVLYPDGTIRTTTVYQTTESDLIEK